MSIATDTTRCLNLLPIIRQTVCRGVPQFRLSPRVESSQVANDTSDLQRVCLAECELPLGPTRHEVVQIIAVPLGRIPAVCYEELSVHLIGLEITDVDDPYARRIPVNRERHLFVRLESILAHAYREQHK